MKRSQFSSLPRFASSLALVALLCGFVVGAAKHAGEPTRSRSASALPPQQISPEGRAGLQAIIQSGNLPDLRWPNFSDYSGHLTKFYDSYGYSLPWVRGMQASPQAQQVILLLMQADEKGLSADDYDGPRWNARLATLKPSAKNPSENDAIKFDLALTACLMRYISDLHIGKVNPKHFYFDLDIETKKYDLPEFIKNHVADSANVVAELNQVEPPYPGYQRTILALHAYNILAKQDSSEQFPAVKKAVVSGDSYAGVPRLARFLRLVGDLPPDANVAADSTVYQGALVDAVKNFQRRHGREPDGKISAQTISDLNVPLNQRVRQMQLMLERWRWLPSSYQKGPIVANIPEFRLRGYSDDFKLGITMNVVVGKAYNHKTPIFGDSMQYVIFRPYWNVPYGIAKNEIYPKLATDPEYLAKKGFEVVDARDQLVTDGAVSPEILTQLRGGKLFVRQKPGPKNSLGLAKFIFPNDFDVYMHDTPEQEFFSRSRRDFSHGCIRVEKPADLAVWVLRHNQGWDMNRVRAAMNGTSTQQVNLAQPIPVLIVYGTVIVPDDGLVHFYDDIYGYDKELDEVLQKGYPYPG